MATKHRRGGLLLVGALALSALGCASHSLSVRSLEPSDLARVAGTWEGTGRGLLAENRPITITVSADGTFTATGTVYAAEGLVRVKEGRLVFTGGFQASGEQAPTYVVSAMLVEETDSGQVVQLLSGSGFSAGRSISFLVRRPKTGPAP
jgi:hypothetical protein